MKTYLAKKETVQPKWYLVDAEGQVLGRLAVKLANIIRGRNKATYTAHVDTGDYVVVLNAEKVVLTGKKEEQNEYMAFSGFVGGERYRSMPQMRAKRPHPLDLRFGRRLDRNDRTRYTRLARRVRDALPGVPSADGPNAGRTLRGVETSDCISGSAQFERVYGLQIF